MAEKPYADTDVNLVANTFITEAKKNPVDPATPPWLAVQTRHLLGPTEHDIARAVLDALTAAGWRPPTRTPILIADAIIGQVTDEMVTTYKRAYQAEWKAAAPVTTQGEATSVERDAVRAGLAAVSQISINTPTAGSCPCTCHQPDRCPCEPGTPDHKHGAGGYCTVGNPVPADARPVREHVIAFAADGTWTIEHPATCPAGERVVESGHPVILDCPVRALADRQIPADLAQLMAGGRYACSVGDIGDVFQLDDRLHDDQCTAPVCAACGCWCHAEEQTEQSCICPDVDVSTVAEESGTRTVKGLDRDCPVHGGHADQPARPLADHPHTDPGDGRTECEVCGKWVWPAIHSCKGVPVTDRARARLRVDQAEG